MVIATVAVLAALTLTLAVIGGFRISVMARCIRRASLIADRLAGGDLRTRMPETGKTVIGRLEHSFNTMAASFERHTLELSHLVETQTALRRVATLVAQGSRPDELLAAVAEELGRLIRTDSARIVRYEADGTVTVVASWNLPGRELPEFVRGARFPLDGHNLSGLIWRSGRPARIDSYEGLPGPIAESLHSRGVRAAIGAPIRVQGRLWGIVAAATTGEDPLPSGAEARLAEYTDLIGTAVANAQSRADLLASRARVVLAIDQARQQIVRDLHDGVQQRLISLGLDVRQVEANLPTEMSQPRASLAAVVTGLAGTLDDVREISRGVHPTILTECGLPAALKTLARRSAVPVKLNMHVDNRLPDAVEAAAYYVVAEALANAAKHAQASMVCVDAILDDGSLRVSVRDDGVGGATLHCGSGLIGLVDRVEAIGGAMTVDSPVGQGTSLRATFPLDHI
ncbi:GAF domain-containing protein [Dactylosporangium sp. CA-092794]|uniref:GAF domain-containing sensor histidine kinase n=1 Tax=Dactylosporangium sp. CA-092794 TaxID=3239929 RepID=UPI003D949602